MQEVVLKATPRQIKQLQPLKNLCEEAYEKGERGLIIMQIDFDDNKITATYCNHVLGRILLKIVRAYNKGKI